MELDVKNLSVTLRGKTIVSDVSLHVGHGEFVGLLGPNGCGKSTTLRAIYRLNRRYSGQIMWDGMDSRSIRQKEFARRVAVVSQFNDVGFDFTVNEVVLMGRSPHLGALSRESAADQAIVDESLEMVDLLGFRDRPFSSLSGGEKQRAVLARAIAQKPEFLVLDEPTNHLDIKHQIEVLAIARDLGVGCLAALHDIAMASHFVDRVCLMKAGRVFACGPVGSVVTSDSILGVYDVQSEISADESGGLSISYRYPANCRRKASGSANLFQ